MTEKSPDHCIIGAGFAGLPVAKKLANLGQTFDIYERNQEVGGIWHSGAYDTARLISSKQSTQYPSFPMPESYPTFPSRDEVGRYLKAYAHAFSMIDHIRFGCEVVRIRPIAGKDRQCGWMVEDQNGCQRAYRTVTIASGHFWKAREVPQIKDFGGEVIRSSDYTGPDIFRGKRVLVIGHANTGADLAVDALKYGRSVAISMRSGAHYFPRLFCGIPTSDLLYYSPLKFELIDRLIAQLVIRRSGATVVPPARVAAGPVLGTHPIVNSDFIQSVGDGSIKVRSAVSSVDGKQIEFIDGETSTFDLVATAVGYDISLPMLVEEDRIVDWHNGLPVLWLNLIAPQVRGLFFSGFGQARAGGGPLFEGFGNHIARMATADVTYDIGIFERLIRLKRMSFLPRVFGVKPIAPLDMRSRGYGELQRGSWLLASALNRLGCPDAAPIDAHSQPTR